MGQPKMESIYDFTCVFSVLKNTEYGFLRPVTLYTPTGKRTMCKQRQLVRRLHIERNVHSEIIRYAMRISVSIQESPASCIVVSPYRQCNRSACAVIQVDRKAEAVCQFKIAYKLDIMRPCRKEPDTNPRCLQGE